MSLYALIRRLQNSPLTSWWWRFWYHSDSGELLILPWYADPGLNWTLCDYKE